MSEKKAKSNLARAYIDPGILREAKVAAASEGITLTEWVSRAVKDYQDLILLLQRAIDRGVTEDVKVEFSLGAGGGAAVVDCCWYCLESGGWHTIDCLASSVSGLLEKKVYLRLP